MNIKYKSSETGKTRIRAHLERIGSCAPRVLAALLEQYQTAGRKSRSAESAAAVHEVCGCGMKGEAVSFCFLSLGGLMRNFRTLNILQQGVQLVIDIYKLSEELPNEEKYGLKSQICRAVVSIPSNNCRRM